MSQTKKKMELSKDGEMLRDAWFEACIRLRGLTEKHNYKSSEATMWEAFKLLYIERVPDPSVLGYGRKAGGINGITD